MTGGTESARAARLGELRRKRAADMLAVIAQRRPLDTFELQTHVVRVGAGAHLRTTLQQVAQASAPPGGRPRLRRCAARELESLVAGGVALVHKDVVRTSEAPRARYGVRSPYLPNMLIVTYETRYLLAEATGGARDVYVVHGALQVTDAPIGRDLHGL